jgi:hypothetical protein
VKRRFGAVAVIGLLGLGLASCASADQTGSPAHRMSVWAGGTGLGGAIGTLIADNRRVPLDVLNGTGAVHAACGTLETDAEKANGELPSPDLQVSEWLTTAYGFEGTAGTECYDAGSTNTKLLAESARNVAKAEALFKRALIRIAAIDGAPVSTTTTTDNSTGGVFG